MPEPSPPTRAQRWARWIAIVLACGVVVAGTRRLLTGYPDQHWNTMLNGIVGLSLILGLFSRRPRPGTR